MRRWVRFEFEGPRGLGPQARSIQSLLDLEKKKKKFISRVFLLAAYMSYLKLVQSKRETFGLHISYLKTICTLQCPKFFPLSLGPHLLVLVPFQIFLSLHNKTLYVFHILSQHRPHMLDNNTLLKFHLAFLPIFFNFLASHFNLHPFPVFVLFIFIIF